MATLFATMKIREGKEGAFEDVARALSAETKRETGCRLYAYYRAPPPRTYYCLLVFDSYNGFLEHQASDYHETLITPRAEELFEDFKAEWLDAVVGASNGVPTQHETPGPQAPARQRHYADAMPAAIQDWWAPLRSR